MRGKDDEWRDKTEKIKVDKDGYERGQIKHSDLIHRQIAYEYIYKKNKSKYPKPFSEYVVHHIDGNKRNNDISNLQILTPEEHEKIHGIIKDKKEKEIFSFEEKARKQDKRINYISSFDLENAKKKKSKSVKSKHLIPDRRKEELRRMIKEVENEKVINIIKPISKKKGIKIKKGILIVGIIIIFSILTYSFLGNDTQKENSLKEDYNSALYDKILIGMTGYEFYSMIQKETALFAPPTTNKEITFNYEGVTIKVFLSDSLHIQQSENSFVINNLAKVIRVELYKNNVLTKQKN